MRHTHISTMHRSPIPWLMLAAAVATAIFLLSAQPASASDGLSRRLVQHLLEALGREDTSETLRLYNHIARKTAHFTLYFLLGFSLTGALRHWERLPSVPSAVLISAVFAALDEFHQHFVAGRGPQVSDVLLDTCGALAGTLLMTAILYLLRRSTGRGAS